MFRSILAIVAGIAAGAILSIVTDKILEITGILQTEPFDANPAWLIIIIIIYRTIFNGTGAYIAARLAPNKPVKHAMILGGIGVILGTTGAIAMWHIPPHWYPVSLVILTLPAAWIGGKLALKNQ
ncbi:MAG: hypothetical protein EOP53_19895 [Sphingobacteriales bacterium]|nr:MAG: hypothetical protein EOP53_19895 [Sphingobacteriales bacterium]